MNTADDLLRRALKHLNEGLKQLDRDILIDDIAAYLNAPKDEPVAWMHYKGNEEELHLYPLISNDIAMGWNQYPLYAHPPTKTAQDEIEKLHEVNFALAARQCTEGGPWGDEGGTQYCKYAPMKPMTEEEIVRLGIETVSIEAGTSGGYFLPVTFARAIERHHGIGERDE